MPPKRMPAAQNHAMVWGLMIGLAIGAVFVLIVLLKQKQSQITTAPAAATTPTAPATAPVIIVDQGPDLGLGVTPQLYRSTDAPIGIQARLAERDRRVDADNLYPPLSRERVLPRDSYRPVAYLVAEEEQGARNDVWKLYARERARGGASDFYAVSADRQFDAKVALTDENVVSQPRLRDVYNLPTSMQIRHPMFRQHTTYQVVEMDRADWGNTPNYF